VDITPPVGIYQGLWGAARHDRATGIHRPLTAKVMVFEGVDGAGERMIRFLPDRLNLPGGELILSYLRETEEKVPNACERAIADLRDAVITYASGCCGMAANRDYWDEIKGVHACGFNPDAPADDALVAARVTDTSGRLAATVVNYACHPTTLAYDNSLLSPDYVGAMREEIERATRAPCVFVLGASGDLGPRDGYTGDAEVADRNGRQVAYAALSALASLGPPATDFVYQGPIISGATLGTWGGVPAVRGKRP
jgi:hypothetical protein